MLREDTGLPGERDPAGDQSESAEPLLVSVAALLERKGQAVLYGPPGTGKTWTAARFANWWLRTKNGSRPAGANSEPPSPSGAWWWVTASPGKWKWEELFENGSESFERGRLARNYGQIAPGDMVIGYASTPELCVQAIGRVLRIEPTDGGGTFVLEPVDRVQEGPTWHELSQDAALENSEPVRNGAQGTLFALAAAEAERIVDLIARRDPALAGRLRRDSSRGPETLERLTFHASYSYEDFVEGFRPVAVADGTKLELVQGVFKEFARRAARDPGRAYLLLIDEFNRANVTKVFGELITLLERDKRGDEVRLPYSKETFHIPENLYVLATMNTADRSITLVDTALRRRFGWVEVMPDVGVLAGATVSGVHLDALLRGLNSRIARTVGRDKQIGHSYFLRAEQPMSDPDEFAEVFATEIVPLLQEYAYDEYEDLADYLGDRIVDRDALELDGAILADPTLLLQALEEHLVGGASVEAVQDD